MEEKKVTQKTSLLFDMEVKGGKLANWSVEDFRKHYATLKDGRYKHKVESISTRYTATRWKYLYDCVYKLALPYAQRYLRIQKGATQRKLEDEKDLHNCMLSFFNSVIIVDLENNKMSTSTESSTKLSDNEYWFPFVESILLYFSESPYYLDIPDFDTWCAIRKNGGKAGWDEFISDFHRLTQEMNQ